MNAVQQDMWWAIWFSGFGSGLVTAGLSIAALAFAIGILDSTRKRRKEVQAALCERRPDESESDYICRLLEIAR